MIDVSKKLRKVLAVKMATVAAIEDLFKIEVWRYTGHTMINDKC